MQRGTLLERDRRIMAITPAFQAGDVGSIPIGRCLLIAIALGKEFDRMQVALSVRNVLLADEA